MVRLPCPACGAEVKFQSGASVFQVCPYCSSMLVREDLDLRSIGKMAVLKEDSSPLQLRATGAYERVPFEVIGRVQMAWEDGMWNEWCLCLADGRQGWLADAQGFYMVTFAFAGKPSLPDASEIQPGTTVEIARTAYEVDDVRESRCIASEGELPFKAIYDRKSTGVDLVGPDGLCASISYSDDGTEIFVGKYVEFDELELANLRQFDGF